MADTKYTGRQRIGAAFRQEELDRVAAYPMSCPNNAWLLGMSLKEYGTDPKKMALAYTEYYNRFKPNLKPDVVVLFQDVFVEVEAMGVKIQLRDEAEPVWLEAAVKKPEDVDKLQIPDPEKDGRMSVMLECSRIVRRALGPDVGIGAVTLGPFSMCGALRGEEQLMMDLIEQPEMVHKMMKICTEVQYLYGAALKKAGSSASPSIPLSTLISAKHHQEFVFPYLKDLAHRWKAIGVNTFYHICGQSAHLLDQIADTGCWAISVDENIDLGEAKRIINGRCVLTGNLDPIDTISLHPERIRNEVQEACRKAMPGGKYILASGCEVPIGTPFENIEAFMEAAWEYGKYPQSV